jgi:tetratricopeptide (TPR) repeat protein
MQLARYPAAIESFTAALALAPSNQVARLNRAIASLRADRLAAAQADYQFLAGLTPNSPRVLFGLGEIAWRNRDTNAAIQCYSRYLSNGVPASAEHRMVQERLLQLKRNQD